jgi:hypothetical protein
MATTSARSVAASLVGWLVVIIVVWVVGGWLLGTLWWLVRALLFLAVVVGLLIVYFKLRDGD